MWLLDGLGEQVGPISAQEDCRALNVALIASGRMQSAAERSARSELLAMAGKHQARPQRRASTRSEILSALAQSGMRVKRVS